MRQPTNLQVFANFDPPPKKKVTKFHHPLLSRFVSSRLFSVPKMENEVKRLHFAVVAEIQEAVTDELNRSKQRSFGHLFRNCTTAQKHLYMPMELILNKICVCLPYMFFPGASIF